MPSRVSVINGAPPNSIFRVGMSINFSTGNA
jgi:hypothetical protein